MNFENARNINVLPFVISFSSKQSFVFVQEDGERSIVMATGATSLMNEKIAKHYFGMVKHEKWDCDRM